MSALRPQAVARRLYQQARARGVKREERSFSTSLRVAPEAPELLISPHWDDAVLDCWDLLSDGRDLEVLNLCGAVPAAGTLTVWDEITGASDSAARARERIEEDAAALALAGRKPTNMPFLDAQYRGGGSPSPTRIDAAVAAAVPRVSRVYVPAAVGGHADHRLARRYGVMLSGRGVPVSLYVDLPYCVAHGWPSWVDGRAPDPYRDPDAFWMSHMKDLPGLGPLRDAQVVRLDDVRTAAKLAAMRTYATQLPALDHGARGLLADPEIMRYEVRWELAGASSSPR